MVMDLENNSGGKMSEKIIGVIALIFLILFLSTVLVGTIVHYIEKNINQPLEYTYKDFSNKDIELAMKYHGINSVTITETECYFVNKDNVKVPLFTDACIEYLYKHKQEEVKR